MNEYNMLQDKTLPLGFKVAMAESYTEDFSRDDVVQVARDYISAPEEVLELFCRVQGAA